MPDARPTRAILLALRLASCHAPPQHDARRFGYGTEPQSYAGIAGLRGTQSGEAALRGPGISTASSGAPIFISNNFVQAGNTGIAIYQGCGLPPVNLEDQPSGF